MQLQYKFYCLLAAFFITTSLSLKAQKKVLVVFPEDEKISIPYTFLKNDLKGAPDSVPMKFLTLKYVFYNHLTQLLVSNNYRPLGGINESTNSVRKYDKKRWYASDSITRTKLEKKKYTAAVVDETNKGYYGMYATADSVDYILFINKVEVGGNIFRRWFATKNYLLDVHFDVYNKNMKHLGGRYLRKKVRLTRSTYWSAFEKQFTILPNELALYFLNMKK